MTRGTVTNKTIRKLQAALKHDRKNAEAHKRLAMAYADKGNLLEAIDEFQAALEINADDTEAWISLASVHRGRGKLYDVVRDYERALAIQPDAVQVQRDLVAVRKELEEKEETICQLQARLRQNLDDETAFDVHHDLWNIYQRLGRLGEANHECGAMTRIDHQHSLASLARVVMSILLPQSSLEARVEDKMRKYEPRVREMTHALVEGWVAAGGSVEMSYFNRIRLTFKTHNLKFDQYGSPSQYCGLATVRAPSGRRAPAIYIASGLADSDSPCFHYIADEVARFESIVEALPGYTQHGFVARLALDESFRLEHAQELLTAMVALKAAEQASAPAPARPQGRSDLAGLVETLRSTGAIPPTRLRRTKAS